MRALRAFTFTAREDKGRGLRLDKRLSLDCLLITEGYASRTWVVGRVR